ncbi:MAG: type IX secretion system outer membrane channel protein PorV [Paludibacteraceae bacterium]|nr:type IX secretion system outer membrane channel protein PorV [Paludibacteraceae bacterium]
MKKQFLLVVAAATLSASLWAQSTDDYTNPIITAMPSLTIAPDATAAGMGDIGVATRPDMNSQHWNAAKYAFIDERGGITASYTPWLRSLVGDIDLAYLAGFYRFDELQAVSAGFTYFSMGKVDLIDNTGNMFQEALPNEWALDVAYSRKLHEYVSMAATLRFLYSDLNNGANSSVANGSIELYPAWTMAADISLYYRQPIELPFGTSYLAIGTNISNLGGKMTYDKGDHQNFIPANWRTGVSYELPFDNYNRLTANLEANKMLVPASKYSKFAPKDENGNQITTGNTYSEWFSDLSSASGWFQSFADAPRGFKEEMDEIQWGMGLEYSYDRKFFGRLGYSHEARYKGNRRYFTLGAGFKLSIVRLDISYCVATNSSNPLNNTMRFTLGFDLYGIKDLVNNR